MFWNLAEVDNIWQSWEANVPVFYAWQDVLATSHILLITAHHPNPTKQPKPSRHPVSPFKSCIPWFHVNHSSPFPMFTYSQALHQLSCRCQSIVETPRRWKNTIFVGCEKTNMVDGISSVIFTCTLIPDCFFDNENVTNAKSRSDLTTKETETLSLPNPLLVKLTPPLLYMPRLVRQELFHARSSPSSE